MKALPKDSMLIVVILTLFILLGCKGQEQGVNSNGSMFRVNLNRTGVYNTKGVKKNPELKWDFKIKSIPPCSPVVAEGIVYLARHEGCLYALDALTGDGWWKFEIEEKISSSPAVAGRVVYFGSHGKWFNGLYAVDARTGEKKWKFSLENKAVTTSSPAVADGLVYFGSENGFLFAVDAKIGTEKWKFETAGCVWSSPAVDSGMV